MLCSSISNDLNSIRFLGLGCGQNERSTLQLNFFYFTNVSSQFSVFSRLWKTHRCNLRCMLQLCQVFLIFFNVKTSHNSNMHLRIHLCLFHDLDKVADLFKNLVLHVLQISTISEI